MLDITMTAVIRPAIILETLWSFRKNLLDGIPYRLIINIDPVGESGFEQCDVVNAIQSFCNNIEVRKPETASFADAFCWTWEQVTSEFFLNLEDDWRLRYEIDLTGMIDKMLAIPDLAILRLSMFGAGDTEMKTWNRLIPYNEKDGFFECPEEIRHRVGFCGHPSLIRKKWIDKILPMLDRTRNPEKQMQLCGHTSQMANELRKWRYGICATPNSEPSIVDLGRTWITDVGLQKKGPKAWFDTYERSEVKCRS